MTVDWIRERIRRYASRGILLDTNLLLLYLVGQFDRGTAASFKRTKSYAPSDLDLLSGFVQQFHKLITTPNILTEISNLAGQLGEPRKSQFFRALSLWKSTPWPKFTSRAVSFRKRRTFPNWVLPIR